METTLQALGHALELWQALYIIAIILAVLSTFSIVLFNFHLRNKQGLRVSNYVYAIAAGLSVLATLAIITKTRSIDIEKDRLSKIQLEELQHQTAVANSIAAKANADAGIANQKAEEAKLKAEQIGAANSKLRIEVANHEAETKKTTADLAMQNLHTSQFAQGLAQQQQSIAQQVQAATSLGPAQITSIGNALRPFSGKEISLHMTSDTSVGRLSFQIEQAFKLAGIKVGEGTGTYMGALFQGITVVVHQDVGHPPLADALVNAFESNGIHVKKGADPSIPEGQVALYIGPN